MFSFVLCFKDKFDYIYASITVDAVLGQYLDTLVGSMGQVISEGNEARGMMKSVQVWAGFEEMTLKYVTSRATSYVTE